MPKSVRVIEYPGELGVCLQHLGILVGRHAQAHVWPEIVSWLKCLSSDMAKADRMDYRIESFSAGRSPA